MLKKYLSTCSSNQQNQLKSAITKINLSQRTINYGTPKIQLNLGSIQNSILDKQYPSSQHIKSNKLSEHNLHKQDYSPSIRDSSQQGLDLLLTQRDETLKFRSTSQNEKKLQLKRYSGKQQCISNEKIRVFDVFNQSIRLNKQPNTSKIYITTKETLKVQLQQQKNNQQNQFKILPNNINNQQKNDEIQKQSNKPPISSKLNESRDILQYMRQNQTNNNKTTQSKDAQGIQNMKNFFHSPQQSENIVFSTSGRQNNKIDIENTKNENILELLLLSTQELNKKLKNKEIVRNQSEEKIPVKIRLRAGSRFPKDFFE
ncbi:unnamed protein product [Paramecium pentaurelia]|uniref:Uncharacterized protein n=1 Tax=Paramecium pentaurelia TaxID=43138 RepID=A0A8S1YBI4_9CILI|nr:unnamed protein product [Paramecium pentaurelia]